MKPAYRRITDAPNQFTLRAIAGSPGAVDLESAAYAIIRRYAEDWEYHEPLPSYLVREAGKYPLHPRLADALATVYGIRRDWEVGGIEQVLDLPEGMAYRILCHWPHVSERDPDLIAYTQTLEKGRDDVQTRCGIGKYLAKLEIPGHIAEKIVHLCRGDGVTYEILRGMDIPQAMVEIIGQEAGPCSCMTNGWRNRRGGTDPRCHPFVAYARESDGWGLAIRRNAIGQIEARALVCDGRWVRSFGPVPRGDYGPADPALEAWVESQGFRSADSWEGCRIDVSHDLFPYLDGSADYVDAEGYYIQEEEPIDGWKCDCTDGSAVEVASKVETWDGDWIREEVAAYMACYTSFTVGRRIEGYIHPDFATALDGDYYLDNDVVRIGREYYVKGIGCRKCEDCGDWYACEDLEDGLCEGCRPEEESEEENAQ